MRRTQPTTHDRAHQLAELRRVVRVVSHRPLRERLARLVDELERDAGWDQVEEIRATHRLAALEGEIAALGAERDAAAAALGFAETELGRVRRQRDAARSDLAELRELVSDELADELVELAARIESARPTSPPMLVLRRAARVVRAVIATGDRGRPGRDRPRIGA